MTDQARLTWALAVSLLFHLLLLAMLPLLRQLRVSVTAPPSVEVDLAQLPSRPAPAPKPAAPAEAAPAPAQPPPQLAMPERQIVSPPDAGEERAPEKARLLSDRDNAVREEAVKRGEGQSGAADTAAKHAAAKSEPAEAIKPAAKSAPQSHEQLAALPKLDQLLPKAGDLLRQGLPAATEAQKPAPAAAKNLLAGNSSAFSLRPGTNDFLPSIREGDLTLLNTKAELFAPFVRRVAMRVFQHLEIALRQAARNNVGGSGREFAEVEAIMNKSGQLVSARVIEHESNSNLAAYRELLNATKPDVFFDANPPPGAEANDGNIHFILLVELMVQSATDPRSHSPSTGYYGIAGVGLDSAPGSK